MIHRVPQKLPYKQNEGVPGFLLVFLGYHCIASVGGGAASCMAGEHLPRTEGEWVLVSAF